MALAWWGDSSAPVAGPLVGRSNRSASTADGGAQQQQQRSRRGSSGSPASPRSPGSPGSPSEFALKRKRTVAVAVRPTAMELESKNDRGGVVAAASTEELHTTVEASVAVAARCRAGCVPLLISYDMYRDPTYDELDRDELVESELCGRCVISALMLLMRVLNLATVGAGAAVLALGFWMSDFLTTNQLSMELQNAWVHLAIIGLGLVYMALPCLLGPTLCLTPNLACACCGEAGREKARLISSMLKYARLAA
jgi:hypothetical protein